MRRGSEHPINLAREFLGRGHIVRGFGAPAGAIPHGGEDTDLRTTLTDFRPDVVLAYVVDSPAAWKGARVAQGVGAELILVEEGYSHRAGQLGRLLRVVGRRLWGAVVRRRTSRVLALDPVAATQLAERGFDADRIYTIPPGVDLTRYRPGLTSHLPSAHGVQGRMILVYAEQTPDVGLDRIVRAFADTVGRSGSWSLVLAGEGTAGPSLRALAVSRGVGASVHWLPKASRDVLPGLLGAATLVLAPRDPSDVGGWRLRRALACGAPVLAAPSPTHCDWIEHDGNGLLLEDDSTEAWTGALRQATGAPDRRQRWGQRARQVAEQRLDWALLAAEVEAVLLGALAEREAELEARTA